MNKKVKILIAEDERSMANALELKLNKSGFDAKAVFDGQTAVDILKKEQYDLLLLDLIMPKIYGLYTNSTENLTEFAMPGIEWISDTLQIGTQLIKSSDLKVSGSGSELLLNIVRSLGGTSYLSGPSGRNYLNLKIFDAAGIKVDFHTFLPFEYPQKHLPFVGGLSVLDYLFNQGNKPWWF